LTGRYIISMNEKIDIIPNPSRQELETRIANLFRALAAAGQPFDTAIIMSRINQFYFTGTMQDGLLVLRKDGGMTYFVRKSLERALEESPLTICRKMASYKDMLAMLPANLGSTFIETEIMPVATLERLRKYFTISNIVALDKILDDLRSIKSEYELAIIAESGRQHQILLEQIIPGLFRAGMSETDFLADLYGRMVKNGHHGVSRFSMFQAEMIAGQIGFGDSSIYPTNFNGPGGMRGLTPAVPLIGSRQRFLQKGDIVFVDIGYGVQGYHTDKTQVYSFGATPEPAITKIHNACVTLLQRTADKLTAGQLASDIYLQATTGLPPELEHHFMGFGDDGVKFLGHGIGLQIGEPPIIASGIRTRLESGMVIALEPKCGIEGVGMVGAEETFVVTRAGPVCLTGGAREIIVV
jgi:Xaa-Pro dipeptidase